jgi:hypothetical protein
MVLTMRTSSSSWRPMFRGRLKSDDDVTGFTATIMVSVDDAVRFGEYSTVTDT